MDSSLPLDSIYLGDVNEFLAELPDESVDLVVSSPPYNLGKEYEAREALDHYLAAQKEVLRECYRALKPTGSIFWQVGAFSDGGELIPLDIRYFTILESLGLKPRNRIVWARQHGLHARNKFSCRHETILWFTKSDDYKFYLDPIRVPQKYPNKKAWKGDNKGELTCNAKGKNPGDIWVFRNVKHNHEERTTHPCQFPEDLVARIVLCSTEKEDVVLDPYMGVGTTAVVARDLERRFVGAELCEEYHELARWRLSGEPNEEGEFPNLKTLRQHVEETGTEDEIEKYSYLVQTGRKATPASKARIYPEWVHLNELFKWLGYEESCFSADLRGEDSGEIPRPSRTPDAPTAYELRQAREAERTLFD